MRNGLTPFGAKNALTKALTFKKAIGAPTKGLYGQKTQHAESSTQEGGHGMLSFHKSHVPNLGNAKAGDAVSVMAHGSVHAVDPNGNMTMHVSDIKPDSHEMNKAQHPDVKARPAGIDRAH